MSGRVTSAVGRNPALRRVIVAFLLFNAVEFGTWVAVLLYAYAAFGPGSIGLVALVQLLPAGAAAPFIASLADRFERRRVLVAGYAVQGIALGVAGAGMLVLASPWVVLAFATVAAAAIAATRPTQGALLPSISRTPSELTAANSVAGTVEGVGLLAGPLGAALILALGVPGHVLIVGAVLCGLAAFLVAGVVRPSREGTVAGPAPAAEVDVEATPDHEHDGALAGLRALRRPGDSRLIVALLAVRMVTSGAMDVLFVLLALDLFRTGDSGAALLSAALGAGTVVGGGATFILVGRQRLAPAMAVSAVLVGAGLAVVAATTSAAVAPVLIAAAGMGYAATDVIGRIVLQRVTPDEVLARVLGALEGIGLVGLSVGAVLVPLLAGLVGINATILTVAALLPAGVAVAWAGLARIDRKSNVSVRTLRLLQAAPVFAPLPAPQLEWLARRAHWLTAEPGEAIIRQGDVGDAYYVLEQGAVRITRDGVEMRITSECGDGFGEIALLHDVRRTATVAAIESAVLLAVERADFLEVVTGHERSRTVAERAAFERRVRPQDA